MKKLFTLKRWGRLLRFSVLSVLMLSGQKDLFAQYPASAYGYTAAAGTFNEITGGTAVAILGDDVQSAVFNIGFNFNYCGLVYTQLRANSNGWLTFGGGTTDAAIMRENNTTNLATIKLLLMPLWDDENGAGAGGSATYLVTGTAPNRVFTFQWKNWQWNWTSAVNISYQVKLYETTNVIEFIYRQEANAGTPASSGGCTIGIADGAATPAYLSLNNGTPAATASSTVFTTAITARPATGQIYRFTPPPPCTTVTTWPAVTPATATPNPVCISSAVVNLNITTAMPAVTGITYQWEWSLNGTTGWTNIGPVLNAPAYAATGITTTRYFRCKVFCDVNTVPVWTSGNTPQVVVQDPGSPTVTNGARCGPGTVNLNATTTSINGSIRWYPNTTATIPLATGNTYGTTYLTQNTTYYAAAVTNATLQTFSVGLPNFIQTNNFITNLAGWGLRFTVTNTCNIDSVGVYPVGTGTITFAVWNATTNALVFTSAPTPAITGTGIEKRMVAVGALNLPPGNYILGISAFTGLTNLHNEGFNASAYPFTCPALSITAGSQGFGGVGTPNVYYFSYDWRVSMIGGCEGPRVPVTATINPSTPVAKTAPAVVCNNAVATIALTPPSPPYPNYTWTPATNLFTDAAATVPYAGGSATTVYMKTTNVGIQTYYMMAGNPNITTGCTFADTVRVWSQPGNVTIKGQPDTICVSGTSTLSLDTIAGYYAGSIQWQDSIPGTSTSFTNIAGATNPTYVTPSLAFGQNRFYRAQIRAGSSVCQSPVKYVVIANPTVISAPDSFNCGPGTVTLTAVTGGNGTAVWYQNATGGLPLGGGSTFVTPYLGTTTSYYVSSGGGGSAGLQTIGAGALVSATQSVTPFSSGWGASKHQYLIRAAELTAAGIPSGARLTSLGLDVVAGGTTYPGFAISMKNTATTALPANYEAGALQVKTPSNVTTAAGINTYILDAPAPFIWDGTSNVLIQTCWSNGLGVFNATGSTVRYDNTTFVATRRGQTDNITPENMCAATTSSTSLNYSQRPKFIIGYDNRCESPRQEVIAYIRPVPDVDLGPDINECVDAGAVKVLDAGVQANTPQFLWDNGSTSQVRAVSVSGTYNVTVTNQYTCQDKDTINVTLRKNPVVELGNDTSVCNGVVLPLDAGTDGISYFWNTGQTTQVIAVNSPGTYNVFVTNNLGCVKVDTITVDMAGQLPGIAGIQITNNGINTFTFTAVNPQNVIGYDWDFGDGTAHSYQASPTHVYANSGNYVVVLNLSSSCGFREDSTSAHIVGINQLNVNNDELTVYPNPSRETATILNKGALKMEKIEVYNVLGQVIYTAKADSKDKHILNLGGIASGIYTIQVYTDKGTVARKLEILK